MAKKQAVKATAIVPASELATIKRGCSAVVVMANQTHVLNALSEDTAYLVLKKIAAQKKEIEKRRKEITQPLNASLKSANALFKEVVAPLVEADGILRDKILAFQRVQQAKADKEMERREKIQASHEERGHETHEIAEVEPEVGVSVVTKRWTYDLVDVAKIPRKYLIPNPVSIRRAIHSGERDIAGLKIYQVEGLQVR